MRQSYYLGWYANSLVSKIVVQRRDIGAYNRIVDRVVVNFVNENLLALIVNAPRSASDAK
jgi:hypothetical protein